MNVWQSARIAVRALRVNKLRSALTMLGIIIGVGAVIAMVAVGSGAQARVAEQIQSLGSNLIVVLSGSVTSSGIRLGHGSRPTISEDDAWAIQREDHGRVVDERPRDGHALLLAARELTRVVGFPVGEPDRGQPLAGVSAARARRHPRVKQG